MGDVKPYAVIDADAHVCETVKTWEYLDPNDRGVRPEAVTLADGRDVWVINGKICGFRPATLSEQALRRKSEETHRNLVVPTAAFGLDDVDLRLRHMDETGTDVQVLHNSLWISPVTDRAEIQTALCKSWNRWMADVWSQSNNRLRWTCVVPTTRPEVAAAEMKFARDNGAVGVCLRPFEGDILLIDEEFTPIFAAAQDLDLTATVHIANGSETLSRILSGRGRSLGGFIALGLPTVEACWALLVSDLPKRFPSLRWAFVEATAGWIPWVLHGLRRRGENVPDDPFSAFRIFVTTVVDDDHKNILSYVSDDVLMLGTDYGHLDYSGQVDALQQFAADDSLSADVRQKILYDNPCRGYGIREDEIRKIKETARA
jgi:predicted TIM-barrel fold metal-dependent hydrolase